MPAIVGFECEKSISNLQYFDHAPVMHYVVDGYSVVHARPELRKALQLRLAHAREMLVRYLQDFQDQTGDLVTVVFDGKGERREKKKKSKGDIEIIFSKKNQSADMLIERLVADSRSRSGLIVVTADRAIENTVGALGSSSISPDSFFEMIQQTQKDFSGWLDEHQWKTKRKFSRG